MQFNWADLKGKWERSALLSRGTPAPDFELPDAAGENTVSLGDLKGESAAAVFVSFSFPYNRQLMRTVLERACPTWGNGCCSFSAGAVTRFPLLEDADGSTFDA